MVREEGRAVQMTSGSTSESGERRRMLSAQWTPVGWKEREERSVPAHVEGQWWAPLLHMQQQFCGTSETVS